MSSLHAPSVFRPILSSLTARFLAIFILFAAPHAAFSVTLTDTLNDPMGRISPSFNVSPEMYPRVKFWFDVYTRYDSNNHIFHHRTYPWVVYKVVDISPIIYGKEPNFWNRYYKGMAVVEKERKALARAFDRLSRRGSYSGLKGTEKMIYNSLLVIPGSRKKVIREARAELRDQLGQRDYFIRALAVSRKYMTYMEGEFERQNLPKELVRLPFVESSFNELARSKVGASGVWQIMPATGKAFGIVTNNIDERNSPLKATRMAARLIRSYHKSLKEWPLTLTAYNHGIGSMLKAKKSLKTSDLNVIIRKYKDKSFGFASSNFYACFLATLYAEEYQDKLFTDERLRETRLLVREVVSLDMPLRLKPAMEMANISTAQLLEYNRDLSGAKAKNFVLPKGFELHLPVGHRKDFVADMERIKTQNVSKVERASRRNRL